MLLKPSAFTIETPPEPGQGLGRAGQLWNPTDPAGRHRRRQQRAKDWDGAIIKQLNTLEVGNQAAQDQISLGKGEVLEEAPDIVEPGTEAAPAPDASSGGPGTSGMPGMVSGGPPQKTESVYHIQNPSVQYQILPVHLSVLIDQDGFRTCWSPWKTRRWRSR